MSGRLLKKNRLQPNKSDYWLFPKIEDWKAFAVRVTLICNLIIEAIAGINPRRHLISVDEKTGIQALERVEGIAPKSKGLKQLQDYEYTRHGTTCLIGATNVANGDIPNYMLNETRTETDFLKFIIQTVNCFPKEDEVILLADQLNIHKSESLVKWIAEQIGFQGDLGKKGCKGILKNMKTRQAFLEKQEHRIRFVFTPKHCSWLNPIENWFAKLQRHAITHGNFSSVNELVVHIEAYIDFYKRCLMKPLKWKFRGFFKAKKLKNINCKEFNS